MGFGMKRVDISSVLWNNLGTKGAGSVVRRERMGRREKGKVCSLFCNLDVWMRVCIVFACVSAIMCELVWESGNYFADEDVHKVYVSNARVCRFIRAIYMYCCFLSNANMLYFL